MLRTIPVGLATCLLFTISGGVAGGSAGVAAQQRFNIGLCAATWSAPRDSSDAVMFTSGIKERLDLVPRPTLDAQMMSSCSPDSATDRDYVVETEIGRATDDPGLLEAQLRVLSRGWKQWGGFAARGADVGNLIDEAAQKLILTLTQPIRIATLRFPQRSGDTTHYGGLSTVLPHMLREGLLASSRIVLVDQDSTARSRLEGQYRHSGTLDPNTSLRFGRLLGANYLITGDYLELDGSLWIDVQCMSVETGQIVSSLGVVVDSVSVDSVHRKMTELADALRTSISEDFLAQPAGPRYLAVSGFAPYPDTPENRRVLDAIVRTAARKLRAVGRRDLRIQDTPQNIEDVIHTGSDRWQVAAGRDADYLLSFQMDRSQRDFLVLDLDIFDPSRPRDVAKTWHVTTRVDSVDAGLVHVLAEVLDSLLPSGDSLGTNEREALNSHPYRGLIERVTFPLNVGLTYQWEPDLFLGVSVGMEVKGGMSVVLDERGHWSVQPGLSFFLIGLRGAPKVIGSDVMATAVYRFRPHLTRNPYIGAGVGYLGVTRFGTGATNYDARFGASLSVGLEQTLVSARKITFEIEWRAAFQEIHPKTLGNYLYGGGRPGGVSVTLGTSVH